MRAIRYNARVGDLVLSSPSFAAGEAIPRRHSCEGEDLSPPLAWTAPPERTRSLALVVDDPDAPHAARHTLTMALTYELDRRTAR